MDDYAETTTEWTIRLESRRIIRQKLRELLDLFVLLLLMLAGLLLFSFPGGG